MDNNNRVFLGIGEQRVDKTALLVKMFSPMVEGFQLTTKLIETLWELARFPVGFNSFNQVRARNLMSLLECEVETLKMTRELGNGCDYFMFSREEIIFRKNCRNVAAVTKKGTPIIIRPYVLIDSTEIIRARNPMEMFERKVSEVQPIFEALRAN